MSFLRPVLLVLVVVAACWTSTTYGEHHDASNDQAFQALFMHLLPVPLVSHSEAPADADLPAVHVASPLVAIPLPGFLELFDGDPARAGPQLVMSNLQVFQLAAVLLVLIAFSGVPAYLRSGRGDAVSRALAGFCVAIRDEMVYSKLGREDGDRFLPFFLALFWFILFMNLLGLVPGAATATASIFVTGALAAIILVAMVCLGMYAQGPGAYWKNLVPHVPGWLWPLMFVVELIGLIVRPFALMIRLFANMTGGHMVVLSFLGLIFFFAGADFSAIRGYGISPVAVGFGVFIMIIEAFVAMLQAYIFTQLSIMFVGLSLHPAH